MSLANYNRRIATFLQRVPGVMRLAYRLYKFIQPKFTIGVVGVVFNNKGEVLIAEHVFHPEVPWGLPGGWVGRNEHPAFTVQREFKEELGLDVDVIHVIHTQIKHPNHLDIAYFCTKKNEVSELSYELLNYGWYPVFELPRINSFHYRAILIAHEELNKEAECPQPQL